MVKNFICLYILFTYYSKIRFRTFTRPSKNLTFDKDTADLLANISLDKEDDWKNQTFTRKRLSRDSSEGFDDDRGSVNSDNSTGHRLNDVGDVQTLARLQEESKIFYDFKNYNLESINVNSSKNSRN